MKKILSTLLLVVMTTALFAVTPQTTIRVESKTNSAMNFTISLRTFQRLMRFVPSKLSDRARTEYKWFREQNLGDADFKRSGVDCTIRMKTEGKMIFNYKGIRGTVTNADWEKLDDVFDYKPNK
ncbi:MAG: hypothetical protein IJE69_04730 [Alistipes sp.]|nr:hypothetical protein [Alistipes sp.]